MTRRKDAEMLHTGQILDNPVSGERFVFHTTADDTSGELLAFEVTIAPGGRVPGTHIHPKQEERFEVLSGSVRFRVGRKTVLASAGDVVVVPPGTAHRFVNASQDDAIMRVDISPALNSEELFEATVALAREGRTFRSGLPKPLDLALFMRQFSDEVRAPFADRMVRAATAPLAWVAASRGLDRRYRESARRPKSTRPRDTRPASGPPARRPASRPGRGR